MRISERVKTNRFKEQVAALNIRSEKEPPKITVCPDVRFDQPYYNGEIICTKCNRAMLPTTTGLSDKLDGHICMSCEMFIDTIGVIREKGYYNPYQESKEGELSLV